MDGARSRAYRLRMEWGRILRIAIALSAAYAVALQALFLSFIPVPAAALTDSSLVLCAYQDADGTGHPEQHQVPCVAICAAMGHGISGAVPPLVTEFLVPNLIATAVEPFAYWVVPVLVEGRPQNSRGPPLI
ncbi:hypothetical protein [Rhodoplanes sp. Z2-YC6860]|uniref:hypothetical protein n=1 Tax=Rhodoplanes sp. Z2-YC6860 TaxID=674703 RepID=UPI0012EDF75C|nr:hypothetical protein [Rhodoplanes sp. Z2-YC6860]